MVTFVDSDFENVPSEQQTEKQIDVPSTSILETDKPVIKQESVPAVLEAEPVGYQREGILGEARNKLDAALSGFNQVVTLLPDAAIASVAELLEKAGVVEPNEFSRDYIRRLVNAQDYQGLKKIFPYVYVGTGPYVGPKDTSDKIMQGVGEGLGFSAFTGPLSSISAQLYSKTAPALSSVADQIKRAVVTQFTKDPTTAVKTEAAVSALAGGGARAEEEFLGTQTGGGAIAAPILGNTLKTLTQGILKINPFRVFSRSIEGKIDDAKIKAGGDPEEGYMATMTKQAISDNEQRALADPAVRKKLEESVELQKKVAEETGINTDDLKMSIAEATEDPILLNRQRSMENRMSDESARNNLDRKKKWFDAMNNFIKGKMDVTEFDESIPVIIFDRIKNRFDTTVANVQNKKGEVENRLNQIVEDITVSQKKFDQGKLSTEGKNLANEINQMKIKAMEDVEKKAKSLNIGRDVKAVSGAVDDAIESMYKNPGLIPRAGKDSLTYQNLPKVIKQFLEFGEKNTALSFQDYKNFKQTVNDELTSALAKKEGQKIKQLTLFEETLDGISFRGGDAVKKSVDEFNDYYRTHIIMPFRSSVVEKVLRKDIASTDEVPIFLSRGEQIARLFLASNDDAQAYSRLFSGDQQKMKFIQDAYIDKIAQSATKNDGTIDLQKIAKQLNQDQRSGILDTLGINESFGDVGKTVRALFDRRQVLDNRLQIINQNKLMKVLKNLADDDNPTALIDKAIKSQGTALMKDIKKSVDRVAAQETAGIKNNTQPTITDAFNSVVLNRIISQAPKMEDGQSVVSNSKNFYNFLNLNKEKIIAAVGEDHFNNIRIFADGMRKITASGLSPGTGDVDKTIIDKFSKAFGTSPAQISTRFADMKAGRISERFLAWYFMTRAARAQSGLRADKILERALYDTDIAKVLAQEVDPKVGPTQKQIRQLDNIILRLGVYGLYGKGTQMVEPPDEAEDLEINISPVSQVAPTEEPPIQVAEITRPTNIPNPGMPQNNRIKPNVADLFPNDATSASIGRRQGITSLV